jgi:hypothetical protein
MIPYLTLAGGGFGAYRRLGHPTSSTSIPGKSIRVSRVQGLNLVNLARHYVNLARCEERFRALVSGFQWSTVGAVLEKWKRREPLLT